MIQWAFELLYEIIQSDCFDHIRHVWDIRGIIRLIENFFVTLYIWKKDGHFANIFGLDLYFFVTILHTIQSLEYKKKSHSTEKFIARQLKLVSIVSWAIFLCAFVSSWMKSILRRWIVYKMTDRHGPEIFFLRFWQKSMGSCFWVNFHLFFFSWDYWLMIF